MARTTNLDAGHEYYRYFRRDILETAPTEARRVLDVGCGAGLVGARLKERGVEEVVGIELRPDVAARAAAVLDRVLTGDVETVELPYPPGHFDCIIYGDVLEHLRDPWGLLRRHRPYLSAGGHIVASVPNVRHAWVLANLILGRWPYTALGPFDITHLRYFTRRETVKMIEGAGYDILRMRRTYSIRPWLALLARVLSLGVFRDFFTLDYVVLARKGSGEPGPGPLE